MATSFSFNEAEAVNALVPEDEEKSTKPKNAKTKGKRTVDIKDLSGYSCRS